MLLPVLENVGEADGDVDRRQRGEGTTLRGRQKEAIGEAAPSTSPLVPQEELSFIGSITSTVLGRVPPRFSMIIFPLHILLLKK